MPYRDPNVKRGWRRTKMIGLRDPLPAKSPYALAVERLRAEDERAAVERERQAA